MDQLIKTDQLKLRFAAALLREPKSDPFKAALTITTDISQALQIMNWADDPIVINERTRLLANGAAAAFLPSKEQQARDIYTIASNEKIDADSRLKAHRLYAEVRGYIKKDSDVNVNIGNNIMIVPNMGTDDDWEAKAVEQQRTLIHGDTASIQ